MSYVTTSLPFSHNSQHLAEQRQESLRAMRFLVLIEAFPEGHDQRLLALVGTFSRLADRTALIRKNTAVER